MPNDAEVAAGMQFFNALIRQTGKLELVEARPTPGDHFLYDLTIVSKGSAVKKIFLVLSKEFLSDLPNTPDFRLGAQRFASSLAKRMANSHPMDFYCESGVPIRISMEWPFRGIAMHAAYFMHVSAQSLRSSDHGIVSVQMTHIQYLLDVGKNTFSVEKAVVSTIRRAVDQSQFRFYPKDSHPSRLETLRLDTGLRGAAREESSIRRFLLGKVYWMGFKQGDRKTKVLIADDDDANYLGTDFKGLIRAAQVLEAQKWIVLDETQEYASVADRLLSESGQFETPEPSAAGMSDSLQGNGSGTTFWDVFICHAGEDKDVFARPLAEELRGRDIKVWFDEFEMKIGDSLRRKIDEGLSKSRYGVVILSPAFFEKSWPQWELDGLVAREIAGKKVILPVWHNVTRDTVRSYSPSLADKLAGVSDEGIAAVAEKLIAAFDS